MDWTSVLYETQQDD